MNKKITVIVLFLLLISSAYAEKKYIHHDLTVSIEPANHFIRVKDTITLPEKSDGGKIHFLLHGSLKILSHSSHIILEKEPGELKSEFYGINTAEFEIKKKIPVSHFAVRFSGKSENTNSFTLTYEGIINHPIQQAGGEYARSFSETPGIICERGIFLAGATFWVPWFNEDLVTFRMDARMPDLWAVISQGARTVRKERGQLLTTWDSPEPMEEVYLIAAPFKESGSKAGKVEVMAFLRSDDKDLAGRYLETTGQYLDLYEKLIGPYPFAKFALIENFWETGYGMPSFTLLGPKVIRFPFILHSSYPHELLHNWWGNGVFVDYHSGNWCEGLTVYLADHLIKEQRGQGEEYRKTALQEYTHYAAGKKEEFPLSAFKARYDALSSSIGYGKSMMMFHMLRLKLADQAFKKSVRYFYQHNKFRKASFDDIRKSFEIITGLHLNTFFKQWVTRTGVPEIQLSDTVIKKQGEQYSLSFSLRQVQKQEPYTLLVPVAIFLEGKPEAVIKQLDFYKRQSEFSFLFDRKPLAIDADPQFDVMRRLNEKEIPATLSSAFGAKSVLILLPSEAPDSFLKGYRTLAETWARDSGGQMAIKMDSDVEILPGDKAVWLFGRENLHNQDLNGGLSGTGAELRAESMVIDKQRLPFNTTSVVVAAKNSRNRSMVVVLLSTNRVAALPGLGRKLPHYGKYSFLAFEGDEPVNRLKGQWPVVNSPMSVPLVPEIRFDELKNLLPKRPPLESMAPLFSIERMTRDIRFLASEELKGRELGSDGLERAATYIAQQFKEAGLQPGVDNSYFQTWETESGRENKKITLRNIIGVLPGRKPEFNLQSVIVCAHYDHLGLGWPDVHKGDEGKIHFGADDNASGVAVMLELARVLGKHLTPDRSILFIAFTGEENGLMGSTYYLNKLKSESPDQLKKIMALVNLDTVGRLKDGQKLMVIGGSSAREWQFIFMGIGYTVGIETQLISQELDASDQVAFLREGIPGIQLFSGPHNDYHRPSDTVDKIEGPGLAKVAAVARETIAYLAERKEPLTFTGAALASGPGKPASSTPAGGRRVRTGIMPDFSFSGNGMKIGAVSQDSPAEKASLRKGDIIIKVGETVVSNLREYANALKSFQIGDTVIFSYLRDGQEYSTRVELEAR
jgi:aminopeptidase N